MDIDLESLKGKKGKARQWHDSGLFKFPENTFMRIAKALNVDEQRTDFVRLAVLRELIRRERQPAYDPSIQKTIRIIG